LRPATKKVKKEKKLNFFFKLLGKVALEVPGRYWLMALDKLSEKYMPS